MCSCFKHKTLIFMKCVISLHHFKQEQMMADQCCVVAVEEMLLVCSGEQRGFLLSGLLTSCWWATAAARSQTVTSRQTSRPVSAALFFSCRLHMTMRMMRLIWAEKQRCFKNSSDAYDAYKEIMLYNTSWNWLKKHKWLLS